MRTNFIQWAYDYAKLTKRFFATAKATCGLALDLMDGLKAALLCDDQPTFDTCESCVRLVGRAFPEGLVEWNDMRLCPECLGTMRRGRDRGAGSWDALFCARPVLDAGRLVGAYDRPRQHTGECWVDEPNPDDIIDEDPPRPEVVWMGESHCREVGRMGPWSLTIEINGYGGADGSYWTEWAVWRRGDKEETRGRTTAGRGQPATVGICEAKRRAEEALAVMLERRP